MNVFVGKGKAWFNDTWSFNDSSIGLILDNAHGTYDRYDAIVLEVNKNSRTNTIRVIKGAPSISPAYPTLIKEDGVYQYALAYILIPYGSSSIVQANIENVVGTNETPYVRSVADDATLNVANNLTTTEEGYVLDARQGPVLDADINGVRSTANNANSIATTLQGNLRATYNSKTIPFRFGIDSNGNYGYKKDGADTVTPFRGSFSEKLLSEAWLGTGSNTVTINVKNKYPNAYKNLTLKNFFPIITNINIMPFNTTPTQFEIQKSALPSTFQKLIFQDNFNYDVNRDSHWNLEKVLSNANYNLDPTYDPSTGIFTFKNQIIEASYNQAPTTVTIYKDHLPEVGTLVHRGVLTTQTVKLHVELYLKWYVFIFDSDL
jgi:hypothetical protein